MEENAFLVRLSLEDLFLKEGPCSSDYFVSRKIERMLTTGMPQRDGAHGAEDSMQEDSGENSGENSGEKEGEEEGAEDSVMPGAGGVVPHIPYNWYVGKQNNCILALLGYCAANPAVRASGNVALSPLSIIGCMAMACRGAVDCQDLEHYCWPFICESADAKAICLEQALQAVGAYVTSMPKSCKTVNILMSDCAIKADFKVDMEKYFEAEQYTLKQWEEVNRLVKKTTQIQKKVLSRAPTATTLIQAIFFQDKWAMGFQTDNTKPSMFNNENRGRSKVMMMHQQQKFNCIDIEALQAVRLGYQTEGVYAWFVMGGEASDADKALKIFLEMSLKGFGESLEDKAIDLRIPRFKAEMNIDLKQAFENTEPEITSIFEKGHLKNMSEDKREFFSTFEHMCYVHVDENGTKAGAVSSLGATRGGGGHPPLPNFTFDKTFWMLIVSGEKILFVAKVDNPGGGADTQHKAQPTPQVSVPEPELEERYDMVQVEGKHEIGICVTIHKDEFDTKGKNVNSKPELETIQIQETGRTYPKFKYKVPAGGEEFGSSQNLIYVTLKNLSETEFEFGLAYQNENLGALEIEEENNKMSIFKLVKNEKFKSPFPLKKDAGEKEDFWHVLDTKQNKILTIGFCL
jgi:serine protease inhibitor